MFNKIVLVFVFAFVSCTSFAETRLLLETDPNGKVVQGSYEQLLEAVRNGADLKLGAGTHTYNEDIYFQSLLITKNSIIGVQPFHTSWDSLDANKVPYRTSFMISTDRKDCFVRYNFAGGRVRGYASQAQDRYNYYRWFVENDKWVKVYPFAEKDGENEKLLFTKFMEKSGHDVKLSFQLKGITYVLKPYILILPKPEKSPKQLIFANVRTYPTFLMDDGECSDILIWNKLSMIEVFLTLSDNVVILDFRQFRS